MIRSSSKLLKKGSSVRNINKVGSKFRFVIGFETADKVVTTSQVVATCERKGTVLSTAPVSVDTKTRTAMFASENLEQIVTLFKSKKGDDSFNEKVYTFYIRRHNDKGKPIGKALLNFGDYAGIPDSTKRISLPLSHDGNLILRITSTYLGETSRKKSFAAESSAFSSSPIGSQSSKVATGNLSYLEQFDQSDLSDLFIDDDFEGINPSSEPADRDMTQSRKKIDLSRIDTSQEGSAASQSGKNQAKVQSSTDVVVPSQSRRRVNGYRQIEA